MQWEHLLVGPDNSFSFHVTPTQQIEFFFVYFCLEVNNSSFFNFFEDFINVAIHIV